MTTTARSRGATHRTGIPEPPGLGCRVGGPRGATVLATACGSTLSTTATRVVSACSPMPTSEAATVFATGASPPHDATATSSPHQSMCFYPGTGSGVHLNTTVSRDPRRLTNFQHEDSPLTVSLPGRTPTGATIPAIHFVHLTVAGKSALRLSPVPCTGVGSPANLTEIIGSKKGYVVTVQSTGLSQHQATQVLGIMLSHL